MDFLITYLITLVVFFCDRYNLVRPRCQRFLSEANWFPDERQDKLAGCRDFLLYLYSRFSILRYQSCLRV